MPNRVEKFLQKLDGDRRRFIIDTVARIEAGDFVGLDCKKLKGVENQYRVRIGRIRIFFYRTAGNRFIVFEISWRSDTTYR